MLKVFATTFGYIVGPEAVVPNTVLAPLQCIDPVPFTVPKLKVAFPFIVKLCVPIFKVPLFIVKLFTVTPELKLQLLDPVTIITLSIAIGVPVGVQFNAVFQSVDEDPFQV
jgi:hypothetical protein